jgi:hypothetical protein
MRIRPVGVTPIAVRGCRLQIDCGQAVATTAPFSTRSGRPPTVSSVPGNPIDHRTVTRSPAVRDPIRMAPSLPGCAERTTPPFTGIGVGEQATALTAKSVSTPWRPGPHRRPDDGTRRAEHELAGGTSRDPPTAVNAEMSRNPGSPKFQRSTGQVSFSMASTDSVGRAKDVCRSSWVMANVGATAKDTCFRSPSSAKVWDGRPDGVPKSPLMAATARWRLAILLVRSWPGRTSFDNATSSLGTRGGLTFRT